MPTLEMYNSLQQMDATEHGSEDSKNLGSLSFKRLHKAVYLYAITIKPTYNSYIKKSKLDMSYISTFVDMWIAKHKVERIGDLCFELDCIKIPHVHFTIKTGVSSFRNFSWKGWHIYSEAVTDLAGWESYIHKDQSKDDYSFIN